MKRIPSIRTKQPHPWNWKGYVDGLSTLGLQCRPGIAPKMEVYFLDTHISYVPGNYKPPKIEPVTTRTGMISPTPMSGRRVIPFTSDVNPLEGEFTQKEILEDILSAGISSGLEVPDAGGVIQRQGIKIDIGKLNIPSLVKESNFLDGYTHLLIDMMKSSSWTGVIQKMLNVRFPNLSKHFCNLIVENKTLKRSELPHRSRMRNVLQLRSVMGMDEDSKRIDGFTKALTNTHTNILPSKYIADALSEGKYYASAAHPVTLPDFHFDGFRSEPRAYQLEKWGIPAMLRLGPDWDETKVNN